MGPIIAVVSVIVLVLGVVGWFQLRDRTDDQGTAAAGTCVEGDARLEVAADPGIAAQVRELADRFAGTAPVIRDHCVTVSVSDADSGAVAGALTAAPDGPWDETLGPAPALWIPAGTSYVNRVADTAGVIDGRSESIAASPVVLAVPEALARALTSADTSWRDLPTLQATDDALDGLGLDGWGALRSAMPTGPGSSSTTLALDAVAVAAANAGSGPLDAAAAGSAQVRAAIAALGNGSAVDPAPTSTVDALAALAAQSEPAAAPLHAVPATEQQVFASSGLFAFAPDGATPVADYPAAVLATPWVDETLSRAAARFVDFLQQPEQAQELTAAGFRVGDRTPPSTERTPIPRIGQTLAPATGTVATALAATFADPAVPRATTILLDVSGSMGYDDLTGSRLGNTVNVLSDRFAALPDNSDIGLWVYSRGLDGNRPYQVKVPTGPLSRDDRRDRLETALRSLTRATATSTYASLIAAHASATDGFVEGRTNSVLLITDGPNDDTSTTRAQLTRALDAAAVPVRVDVIAIGENSDAATLQDVAARTGGTYAAVPNVRGPEFAAAVTEFLS